MNQGSATEESKHPRRRGVVKAGAEAGTRRAQGGKYNSESTFTTRAERFQTYHHDQAQAVGASAALPVWFFSRQKTVELLLVSILLNIFRRIVLLYVLLVALLIVVLLLGGRLGGLLGVLLAHFGNNPPPNPIPTN